MCAGTNTGQRRNLRVDSNMLLLGVDGGGTSCRARLCTFAGEILGEGITGPANLRLWLGRCFGSINEAPFRAAGRAGLPPGQLARTVACLALAGASEPTQLAAARAHKHHFGKALLNTRAHAACISADR